MRERHARVAVTETMPTTAAGPRDVAYGLGELCIPSHMFHQTLGGSEHSLPDSLLPTTRATTHHPTRDGLGPAAGPAAATDATAIMGWVDVHSVLREVHHGTGRTGATF